MLPLLPTHAHKDLAEFSTKAPPMSDPDRFFSTDASLAPDPLFMALRGMVDRITRRFGWSEPTSTVIPPRSPATMPVIEHPACRQQSSDEIAA